MCEVWWSAHLFLQKDINNSQYVDIEFYLKGVGYSETETIVNVWTEI